MDRSSLAVLLDQPVSGSEVPLMLRDMAETNTSAMTVCGRPDFEGAEAQETNVWS